MEYLLCSYCVMASYFVAANMCISSSSVNLMRFLLRLLITYGGYMQVGELFINEGGSGKGCGISGDCCGSPTCMASPVWHHLYGITCMASPAWHHLYGITCMASPAWHHLHGITCMASPVWHHLYGITCRISGYLLH
eukprot:GHVR01052668.1.p1 GENE.GHVR01052668.1~~GHVR01052668.1.p1  ORF type:complete len:137 (-),score=20.49 GHVR01052668.1:72-482(-)